MDIDNTAWTQELLNFQGILSHRDNLVHKLTLDNAHNGKWKAALELLVPQYLNYLNKLSTTNFLATDSIKIFVEELNSYLGILNTEECNIFVHQSDFKSSVLAEFFSLIFDKLIEESKYPFKISTQSDVIFECFFDALNNGRIITKKKKVDFAIKLPCKLVFAESLMNDFSIPLIVMETKTNMDKNMISGIEHSAESLKRTFPSCLYLAVTELADFDYKKQNYAATKIDDLYVLRKQRRIEVRNGSALNDIDVELVKEIITKITEHIKLVANPVESLSERMIKGKLIGGNRDVI